MLRRYRHEYEKITMGLLSYVPGLKDISNLKNEMNWYQSDSEKRKLFVWMLPDKQQIIAVIGIKVEHDSVLIRHISINPSFRKEGLSFEMLGEIQQRYPKKTLLGTIDNKELIARWEQSIKMSRTESR